MSMRRIRSPDAISPPRRSVRITVPERSTKIASPVSRRWAIRRDWSACTWCQVSRSSSSVISSSGTESSERPPVCSYTSITASGPSSDVAISFAALAPAAIAAYARSASCSSAWRSDWRLRPVVIPRSVSRRHTR